MLSFCYPCCQCNAMSTWKTSGGGKESFILITALSTIVKNVKVHRQQSAAQTHVPIALVSAFTYFSVCCLHFSYCTRKPRFPVICLACTNALDTSYQSTLRESLWFTIAWDSFCRIACSYRIIKHHLKSIYYRLERREMEGVFFVGFQMIFLLFFN